jgi:GntR family transcriptional regulator
MPLRLEPDSPLPFYYQIREQLRQQIMSGKLVTGDVLPSEAQICAETGISRMTARQALAQLANEGLVTRQRGRGTFVCAPKATLDSSQFPLQGYTELLGKIGMQAGAKVLAQVVEPATEAVAGQLKIARGEPVVRIARQRLMRDEVMSLETSFYLNSRVPGLVDFDLSDQSIYRLIEERYGLSPSYATDTVELSVAGPYEARELKVGEGVPLVLVTRLSFLADNTPLEFTQAIHRGDRFRSIVFRSRQQLR